MKLLELTRLYYPSVGGMERFVYDRTKIYDRLGIRYTVLSTTMRTPKRDTSFPVKNVTYLPQITPYNIVPSLPFHFSDDYDFVSVNSLGRFSSDYAIYHYASRKQIIILTPYFAFHSDRYSMLKKIFENHFFPYLLDKVNAVVVFTQSEKDYWITKYRIYPHKIYVIPPYIDVQTGSASNPVTERYLLYLGRREANKKTDLLLESFLRYPDQNLTLKMTLDINDVRGDIRSKVLNDKRIRLLGFVTEKDKNKLLSNCDALVFPTSWESFGYVAFEASRFKKPLLCSDIPVLKELLDPGGVLFFNNTPESIYEALTEFSSLSGTKKKEMGRLNYNNLEKFSFDLVSSLYESMFRQLLEQKNHQ